MLLNDSSNRGQIQFGPVAGAERRVAFTPVFLESYGITCQIYTGEYDMYQHICWRDMF